MNLGEKLLQLRKEKHLSQEEVAEKLNVTRQTISKWETDQSTPDFDKILPLCELYGITANELLTGIKDETQKQESISQEESETNKRKKAFGIGLSVLIYFIATIWIIISIPVLEINPIVSTAIFLLIAGIATFIIIYTSMVYKDKKEDEDEESPIIKRIDGILSLIVLMIYLSISFATMAWHITWLIWIVYGLIMEIIKLIFSLRGKENEK